MRPFGALFFGAVLLGAEQAACDLHGLYVASGKQVLDHLVYVDHASPRCVSREVFKGVLDGASRGVFAGRVHVREGAQKTDAKQTNMNLLLSEDAQIDTKPQLEIYADDVKCSHGAAVGQLDPEELFYLQSRGMNADDARNLLTYGFAELDVKVQPTRQDLVLALFKVLMEVFQSLSIPVVVAFDQLEDLLLARRNDDGHRTAEAFFAGIVQAMHQISGVCFLVFAERGLWNRFVPSLDGYIQDRLNNPIHVPGHGTIKALRLEAPPVLQDLAAQKGESQQQDRGKSQQTQAKHVNGHCVTSPRR